MTVDFRPLFVFLDAAVAADSEAAKIQIRNCLFFQPSHDVTKIFIPDTFAS